MLKSLFFWTCRSALNIGIPYLIAFIAQHGIRNDELIASIPIIFFVNVILAISRNGTLISIFNRFSPVSVTCIFFYQLAICCVLFIPVYFIGHERPSVMSLFFLSITISCFSAIFSNFLEKHRGLVSVSKAESFVSIIFVFTFLLLSFEYTLNFFIVGVFFVFRELVFFLFMAYSTYVTRKVQRNKEVVGELVLRPLPILEVMLFSFYWAFPVLKDSTVNSFLSSLMPSDTFGSIFSYQLILTLPSLFMAMLIRPLLAEKFVLSLFLKKLLVVYYIAILLFPWVYWLYLANVHLSLVKFYVLSISNFLSPLVAIATANFLSTGRSKHAVIQNVIWLLVPVIVLLSIDPSFGPWTKFMIVALVSNLASCYSLCLFYMRSNN